MRCSFASFHFRCSWIWCAPPCAAYSPLFFYFFILKHIIIYGGANPSDPSATRSIRSSNQTAQATGKKGGKESTGVSRSPYRERKKSHGPNYFFSGYRCQNWLGLTCLINWVYLHWCSWSIGNIGLTYIKIHTTCTVDFQLLCLFANLFQLLCLFFL